MKIKTRFAPSPTGYLHVGSVRTALYSWLFARHNGGKFVLRIEDSDLNRSTQESTKAIIDSINWLNLEYDEGPYFQSKRLDRYNAVIDEMLAAETAYKCFCSKERLHFLREKQKMNNEKPHYDGFCRRHRSFCDRNELYVIRFANPKSGSVIFNDQIRGLIECNNRELDDLIIRRTDGLPTYNFCVVIDDWDMEITHVIRGEDHISNTFRQINILKALNAPVPIYAHLPMIVEDSGEKLSKRHSAVDIMQYREDGYLPEAILNHLVRLGWSNGNQEIFTREEMVDLFSLSAIGKSASRFNANKLLWLNHHYINNLPMEYVAQHLQWHIEKANINLENGPKITELINLFGRRYKTLKEIAKNCRFFYEEFNEFDSNSAEKHLHLHATQSLKTVRDKLSSITNWTPKNIQQAIQTSANELTIETSQVSMPLRVAVTGSSQSPALNMTVHAIGKLRCITRINKALDFIARKKK